MSLFSHFTSPAVAVEKYCDGLVCLCVCLSVRKDIFETTREIYAKLLRVAYGRGSVLLRRRCDKLCVFGFVDGIMFFLQWAV